MEANKKVNHQESSRLRNIAEVTEEYNTTVKREVSVGCKSDQIEKSSSKQAVISRYGKCLQYLLSYCRKPKIEEFDVNQSEITKQVQKLKRRKNTQTLIPPIAAPHTKTLVLDLDQTLLHSSFKKTKNYDFVVEVQIKGVMEKIYVTKRFGLDIFLFEMSQLFELVIFTAGLRDYTDQVLKLIDPKKRIKHTLYRQHCTLLNKTYFLKNLSLLGRNLKQTLLIDDNSMAGMMNLEIFYKIDPFYGNSKDRKLLRLTQFLKLMSQQSDFSTLKEKRKEYEIKTAAPVSFFNHDLESKGAVVQNQSTEQSIDQPSEQSTISKEQSTAMEMVKNVEEL